MAKKYQKGAKKHQKVLKVLPVLAYTTLVPCKLKIESFRPTSPKHGPQGPLSSDYSLVTRGLDAFRHKPSDPRT